MLSRAQDAYVESRVLSGDPLELVRLLYQTAIGAVVDARRHLAAGKIGERSRSISKASQILIELTAALDHQRGGDISRRLASLYRYMLGRLLEANLKQSEAPLAEVLGLLTTLGEAWEGIRPAVAEPPPAPMASTPWTLPQDPVSASVVHAWSA